MVVKTWSLVLRKERILRVFDDSMLRKRIWGEARVEMVRLQSVRGDVCDI